jgi:hypothetical protein
VNIEIVIIFLSIQGILFSSLAPYNLPSYFAAEIPLAIIVAFIYRRWIFIGLTWLSSFLSFVVMQTINHVCFIIYFSNSIVDGKINLFEITHSNAFAFN